MSTDLARIPRVVTPEGEIIELALGPLSVEEALARLPQVQEAARAIRRFEAFLTDTIAADMRSRGQSERRAGDVVYELKADAQWVVDEPDRLWVLLGAAVDRGEITDNERSAAIQQVVSFKPNHTHLGPLAKRIPEINQLRRRVEGEPRLRVK